MPSVIDGRNESVHVPAGHQMTVNATLGAGRVVSDAGVMTAIDAGATETFGPSAVPTFYRLYALDGPLVYAVEPVAFPTLAEARAFGTDLVELSGDGAPDASVQASLDVNPDGDDNGLTITAVTAGEGGDLIQIEYVDPGVVDAALAVSVRDKIITVSLATDSEEAIESTAADVLAALEASADAAALVGVEIDASDSGSGDDGSGVVTAMARAPLANGAGVGAGVAGIGSRYTDVTNGVLYINTGTKAVPVWGALAAAE